MIEEKLERAGLGGSEVRVYVYLLQNGASTPAQIGKGTGIARTNCYHVLRGLKEKHLIGETEKRKRKTYYPKEPESFLLALEERKGLIQDIIPELRSLYAGNANKPKIRFYEGWEEVKHIYWETLSAEKLRGIGSVKKLTDLDSKFFTKYVKELKKRHVIFDDILTGASRDQGGPEIAAGLQALYSQKFLPAKYSDVPTDLLLWSDNIALISLDEPVFGTVLTNPALARSFKAIFDILRESLS